VNSARASSDQELYDLCREISERDGTVTANRLRDAAGGGGYNRLKAIVEAWNARQTHEAARPAQAIRRRPRRDDAPSDTPVPAETDRPTLEHVEQEALAAEEVRVAEALAGAPAEPTVRPERREREPTAVAEAPQAALPAAGSAVTAEASERAAEPVSEPAMPVRHAVPSSEADRPSWSALQAENARLHAHLEDLRRENERLWVHVHEERTARIHEIKRLNGLIASVRRA
jgi:hypothetical protein